MIPNIIHRCWFGVAPMSPLIRKCEASLQRLAAGYELRLWTDANCPDLPFVTECRRWRKWALLSDYIRLHALLHEGGIYLDTDVEVLRPFDDLLGHACFVGLEQDNLNHRCIGNAVLAAEPGHAFIRECHALFRWSLAGRVKPFYGVKIGNIAMFRRGLSQYGTQTLGDVQVFSREVLFPHPQRSVGDAYCIHHLEGSWHRRRGWQQTVTSLRYRAARTAGLARRWLCEPATMRAWRAPLPRRWDSKTFARQLAANRRATAAPGAPAAN
jgi:hypothetical protein